MSRAGEHVVVWVMTENADEAQSMGRAMVEKRLAACANVLPGARSIYWWEGTVQEAGECLLVLKTRGALAEDLVAAIASRHSYDTPGVVVLPVAGAHEPYLTWIDNETELPKDQTI